MRVTLGDRRWETRWRNGHLSTNMLFFNANLWQISEMVRDGVSHSRFSVRLLPLARTCFSDTEALKDIAAPIITAGFKEVRQSTLVFVHALVRSHQERLMVL